MDRATIQRLADLLIDLDRAGIQELRPEGGRQGGAESGAVHVGMGP